MDPVNKWLTVICCFALALLCVIAYVGGSGKYAIYVTGSDYEGYQMVYVVNTKNGQVKAKLHNTDVHLDNVGKVRNYAVDVVEEIDPNMWKPKYSYDNPPIRKY